MAVYPTFTAGQKLTAALLTSAQEQFVYKTADTVRTATTTMADDPDLAFTVEANGIYKVEFHIHYAAVSTEQFRTQWTVPSGASGLRSAFGIDSTVSSATPSGIMRTGVHQYTSGATYGDRNNNTNQCLAIEESVVTVSTTAGTVALQWAQATSGATGTRVAAGSYGRCKRLA
jgi:hypothetical protein